MNSFTRNSPQATARLRPFAAVALMGIALLASTPAAAASQMKSETVDQRIADLHKSLKITTDEETNWASIAQVMRDNDAALKVLVTARTVENREKVSAVEDLKMYERFAQAHTDGLKNLISSFETLYGTMPAQQKLIADGVFAAVGQKSKSSVH